MKKLLMISASFILSSSILFSCGSSNEKSISEVQFDTKRVGEEKYGFIDVPDNWEQVEDTQANGNNVIMFNAPDQSSIITMQYLKDTDAVTSSMNLGMMLDETLTDLTSAACEFSGTKAYQLGGLDSETGRIMACWLFDDERNLTHVVSIESSDENILQLCDTYMLDK